MIKNSRGVSLVETVMAIALFAIGITALLGVFTQTVTVAKRADHAYVAYQLAKNRVERLKQLDFASLSTANETSMRVNREGTADPAGEFLRSTTVTTNYSGDLNLTQIDVKVFYEMRGVQSPSSMDVTTVIFNGG